MENNIIIPKSVQIIQGIVGWDPSSMPLPDTEKGIYYNEVYHEKECKHEGRIRLKRVPIDYRNRDIRYKLYCEECGAITWLWDKEGYKR